MVLSPHSRQATERGGICACVDWLQTLFELLRANLGEAYRNSGLGLFAQGVEMGNICLTLALGSSSRTEPEVCGKCYLNGGMKSARCCLGVYRGSQGFGHGLHLCQLLSSEKGCRLQALQLFISASRGIRGGCGFLTA